MTSWKERLAGEIQDDWAQEIDAFEEQMQLRREGKIEEKLFAETRLRRGVYGQRYDNGQRHDGEQSQPIVFPCGDLTKGPETVWDAPGMTRIKIPFGGLTNDQLDVLADLAEEYSDAILHITTRQDVQLHFFHIDDAPDLMRRLAAVGITTREACGNSVRNVTACPYAGTCNDESFDVTPYADACWRFLLGHPDVQDFGRKFKISFSGCKEHACALAHMHDLGVIATTREVDGERQPGFIVLVGGGLGAVPHQAQVLSEFVTPDELLPVCQAVSRVFARLGEKANRSHARIKFVVKKLGIEEFRRVVAEERKTIPPDPRWTEYLADIVPWDKPLRPPKPWIRKVEDDAVEQWRTTNVRPQAQSGYSVVHVTLPLGDMTSGQARKLADIAREFTGDTLRATVDQNVVLRWVSDADIPAVYRRLEAIGLHRPGAGTIADVTACPGTDTCKLGISASRGLAGELNAQLLDRGAHRDAAVGGLRIKTSGCFNACGQHHIADLGFIGVSRLSGGRRVPHFQVVVGGQWSNNAGAFGLGVGAVPSRRVPQVVDRLTARYAEEREEGESFQAFIKRVGKASIRKSLQDLMEVPAYEIDKTLYHDWGDPREYTIGDMGQGECAGEVVSIALFGLSDAEREVFGAQEKLDSGDATSAAGQAYNSMVIAAKALVRAQTSDVGDDPDEIVSQFRTRYVDTELFFDKYAKGKFASYLLRLHGQDLSRATSSEAHQHIEEAQLFIEAAYACEQRMSEQAAVPAAE